MRFPPLRLRATATPAILRSNSLIHRYGRLGRIEEAEKVFHAMPERDVVSFNSLIASYFLNHQPLLARHLFDRMPLRDTSSYNAMLSGILRSRGCLPKARAFFDSIPHPNVVSWTTMVRGYIQHGRVAEAEELFLCMPERSVVSWTVMLGGLIQDDRIDDARRLFDQMPEKDVVAWTAMISGYCTVGRTTDARELFDNMPKRNVISWTAMISGYAQNLQLDLARKLFEVMPERNDVTWTAIITGYAQSNRVKEAATLFQVMPEKSVVACNAMILGFGQHGMVREAKKVFDEMVERDDGAWSAIVKIFEQNGLQVEALAYFRCMQMNGIRPNFASIVSVLVVCSSLAILNLGREVHAALVRSHFSEDVFIVSALLTMYVKCGELDKAKIVFDNFDRKDVVMWNSMITAYAQHGLGEKALSVFDDMRVVGMVPDEITYIGVLLACSYAGKVKEGQEIFQSMSSEHLVELRIEHYSCMIDLLGRSGRVIEAVNLIKEMPMEADAVVWGALLGACRTHRNAEIAEVAAKKLVHLEPGNAGHYVLLSNIYASSGRWEDVADLRKVMSSRNVSKSPGCSWIEFNKKMHMFTSGDVSADPEYAAIMNKLEHLDAEMKTAGYSPDGAFALHDVDEEEKAHNLRYHSERLAVAFGILKIPEGLPIRVMKNLRVSDAVKTTHTGYPSFFGHLRPVSPVLFLFKNEAAAGVK
ncbi:hypothetical protein ZIOFF_045981 [Zingiber officinale]|uniref:DYW domain-containing protein n=1 Tax=Zingiber officinale TaxID=94328 RepID=A0A8J5KYV3_ZINOF|nr:hypothetical protein ZIOFF_045981 [Zingiber officinale]